MATATAKTAAPTQIMTVVQVKRFNRWWSETTTETRHQLPTELKEYMRQAGGYTPSAERMIYSMFSLLDRTCYCASENLDDHPKLQQRVGARQYEFRALKGEEYDKMTVCFNSHIKFMEYAKKVCCDAEDFISDLDCIEGKGYEHYADAFREFSGKFEELIASAYLAASVCLNIAPETEEE